MPEARGNMIRRRSAALADAKGTQGRRVSRAVAMIAGGVVAALILGVTALLARVEGDGLELVNIDIDASPHDLAVLGDTLYFLADGRLWRSDGTEAGTQAVADVTQGATGWTLEGLTAAGDTLYFWARAFTASADVIAPEGEGRAELWRSDGTAAGTHLITAILPEADRLWVSAIVPAGDTVFMMTDDGYRETLWRSDGTAGGAQPLVDLSGIGFVGGYGEPDPPAFVVMADAAYFMLQDLDLAPSLGTSDGTVAGTRVVARGIVPRAFAAATDLVYFTALVDNSPGLQVWRTDGTTAGTAPVADVQIPFAADVEPAVIDEVVYFSADDDGDGEFELWRSDGTEAGTRQVKVLGDVWFVHGLAAADDALYFVLGGADDGYALWRSDGTEVGTHRVAETDVFVREVAATSDTLFIVGKDDEHGSALWRVDILSEEA